MKGEGIIAKNVKVGKNTKVWHYCNLYECEIGENCIIGSFTEIGKGVKIGSRCKIECGVFIPSGITIEDEVFVGPHVVFTNDKYPIAIDKWNVVPTMVKRGASIGANATIRCGVTIGENAMIGCGAVVTKNVPANETWVGNPAKPLKSRKT
jgi:acetyltransferase-like isoleucine patch superfamily enzyme